MNVTERKTGGLGRGLASLIPQRPGGVPPATIPIEHIRHNPYQPRLSADVAALESLAASIADARRAAADRGHAGSRATS